MKSRGVLIAGNWKMNFGTLEAVEYFENLKLNWTSTLSTSSQEAYRDGRLSAWIFPPMLTLERAVQMSQEMRIQIGAQNVHWEKSGAFTGEVSGPMVKETGINTALVGHSERRQYFGETDETVRKRTESLLDQGFHAILCIGETRSEREAGETRNVITRQLDGAIPTPGQGAAQNLNGRLIIAYEPVWAIGTGLTATPEQAEEAHQLIRSHLTERFGANAAEKTPILYGGSVSPQNIQALLACPNIDGALVGGASLKPDSFLQLLEAGGQALA